MELPPGGRRQEYVQQVCADDEPLLRSVEELLDGVAIGEQILEAGAPGGASSGDCQAGPATGDCVGRYKLLEKIGEGGCGVVYMAEQEEPVRRKVALKLIKPGMDSQQVIARFEAERQALAMMDHPNIARVFDGGVTGGGQRTEDRGQRTEVGSQTSDLRPSSDLRPLTSPPNPAAPSILRPLSSDIGRPYFVMELVRGVRITDYCQEHALSTRARLDLFMQVCSAVQHAHQKGIIHRDLKPSNILVTELDGRPVPKVIDFGIARATEQKLTDKTLFTQFAQFLGTPAYMSPEQAALSGADVDTRSDIYSLGVLLYELLTGTTPFDARELLASGLEAMCRTIRETDPPKPSTRLTQSEGRGQRTEGRGRRSDVGTQHSSLRTSHSALPSDLDCIVMKALEKDRARRYETASSLAQDVQRHLNDEPVTARPASAAYRFRKMVRRNKLAFAAGSAVAAALVIGLGVSTWMYFREKRARDNERQALERAVAAEQEQSRLRQVAEAAELAQRGERNKAEAEATRSYEVVGFLEEMLKGVGPSVAAGRDTTLLREILDKTGERIGSELKDQPEVEAELRETLGRVYFALADFDQSEAMHRAGLARLRALHQGDDPKVARALRSLADVLCAKFKLDEAEPLYREALAMQRKLPGDGDGEVASTLTNYALLLSDQRKLPEAEAMFREALARHRKLSGDEHKHVTATLNNLALVVEDLGRPAEAETMHREVLALKQRSHPGDHPDVAITLRNLAGTLNAQGKRDEAVAMYHEALAMMRKVYPDGHLHTAAVLGSLGLIFGGQGRHEEAEPLLREALDLTQKFRNELHPELIDGIGNLALNLGRQGKFAEAETLYREAVAKARAQNQPRKVANCNAGLAAVLEMQGKFADAEPLRREVLEITRQLPQPHTGLVERRLSELDENLCRQGKYADAEPLAREALKLTTARLGTGHHQSLSAMSRFARLLSDWAWNERETNSALQSPHGAIVQRAREAEQLMRGCMAAWLIGDGTKAGAADHMTPELRSRLGGALVAVAATDKSLTPEASVSMFAEAEPLLLAGNEAIQNDKTLERKFQRDSLTRLVRLYAAWDKPDKASEWRQKLAAFEEADAAPDDEPGPE